MPIISEKTIKELNKQLNEEHYSANLYFNMAGWCSKQGLNGCAAFLNNHAAEEHTHLEKFNDFIKKAGGQPIIIAMKEPEHDFKSVEEVFDKVVKHERYITALIKKLVDKSMDDKDYITLNFLDWFMNEQFEEEGLFNNIMDTIKILGDLKGRNLYTFDKFIANLDKQEHNN